MWLSPRGRYAVLDGDKVVLYYEQYDAPFFKSSKLFWVEAAHSGKGAWAWSKPTLGLAPALPWEKVGTPRIGNPFVFWNVAAAKWWLYYSASAVHLPDADIDEPLHVGLAQAETLRGPWTRSQPATPLNVSGGAYGTDVWTVSSLKLVKPLCTAPPCAAEPLVALCNRVTFNRTSNATGSGRRGTRTCGVRADPSTWGDVTLR